MTNALDPAVRRSGIGGSDSAAALGVSRFKTQYRLWAEKRGEVEDDFEVTERMLWGTRIEHLVRQEYAERTGRTVRLPIETLRHPVHTFMIAHPDGVTEDGRLYEGKCAGSSSGWGPDGSDQIPDDYMIQVQHYLIVLSLPVADVAVLIGGNEYRQYEIAADAELQTMLIDGETEFWRRVQENDPPSMATPDDVKIRYGRSSRSGAVEATEAALAAVEHLTALKARIKEAQAESDEQAAVIQRTLGDNDTLVHEGQVLATWKATSPTQRFDADAFRNAHPKIYKEFLKPATSYRRLLLK